MPTRVVDTLDQIGNDRALGKRHEADRGAESYLLAEDRRPPQRQGDARRTDERGIVDVLDVDEVCDDGDALVVKNRGQEQRIALADIKNVNYSPFVSPPRVTLSLRRPTVFGDQISFCAPVRLLPVSYTHLTLPTNREV